MTGYRTGQSGGSRTAEQASVVLPRSLGYCSQRIKSMLLTAIAPAPVHIPDATMRDALRGRVD